MHKCGEIIARVKNNKSNDLILGQLKLFEFT